MALHAEHFTSGETISGTMVHPAGATGMFTMKSTAHGRSFVPESCFHRVDGKYHAGRPKYFAVFSLTSKAISGPGLQGMSWTYDFSNGDASASWADCTFARVTDKTVTVTDPERGVTRHTFGNRYRVSEGRIERIEEGWDGTNALRTTTFSYRARGAGPYPELYGEGGDVPGDGEVLSRPMPLERKEITQQGVTFTWNVDEFDSSMRPVSITRSSSMAKDMSRTDLHEYYDHIPLWVLDKPSKLIDSATKKVVQQTDYNPTAQAERTWSFGRALSTFTYHGNGTLASVADGKGQKTSFSSYVAGIPTDTLYPDGTTTKAAVTINGYVESWTDEAGFTTTFGHDAMGRISSIRYPKDDAVAWNDTIIDFGQRNQWHHSLAPGHWRQLVHTGNGYTATYFDALLRPIYVERWDALKADTTRRVVKKSYDSDGHLSYESYPKRNYEQLGDGIYQQYDALGRPTVKGTISELDILYSGYAYLDGFETHYTDNGGNVTRTWYQAFDEPSDKAIRRIEAPLGVTVDIARDLFDKPLSVTRSGNDISIVRKYVYDEHSRLCRTIEPETGSTVRSYDAADNVTWTATGLRLGADTNCYQDQVGAERMVSFQYDLRNRLKVTRFGDKSPQIERKYTPDGLLSQLFSDGIWTNTYNKRRLLEHETLTYGGRQYTVDHNYDANGSLKHLVYPVDGLLVDYAPNALGEPTKAGAFASNITYHPSGAIAGFTYGNGIVHTMTPNRRGLPNRSTDTGVLNDVYTYDGNANVASITDEQQKVTTRTMSYDALDRLKTVNAPALWGLATYEYDAIDNLISSKITAGATARTNTHEIDYSTNRLKKIASTVPSYSMDFAYDANGNTTKRGAQSFVFDLANRLKQADGKGTYVYDGFGRRISVVGTDGVNRIQVYGQDGKFRYAGIAGGGSGTKYIYLHNHLIANTGPGGTFYYHTDALGSPVALTNSSKSVTSRTRYEPYGATAAGNSPAIGFTGHVNAADIGLVYMQQRFYDPIAGRFLSIDPVTTDANTSDSFNRYAYAENSPYKYIDPDGRQSAMARRNMARSIARMEAAARAKAAANKAAKPGAAGTSQGRSDSNASGVSNGERSVGISSSLPKPPTGPGGVPKSERDPKRHFTPGEREAKRQEQGNKCGNGCGKDIDQSNSDGHHEVRHADGGRTTPDNHREVCKDCHNKLHSGE